MSENNLGRVQGGGFFGSTSASTTSIPKDTVIVNGVNPLNGDTIVNANGDLCQITAIGSTAYTASKYGNIKGATGQSGGSKKSLATVVLPITLSGHAYPVVLRYVTDRLPAQSVAITNVSTFLSDYPDIVDIMLNQSVVSAALKTPSASDLSGSFFESYTYIECIKKVTSITSSRIQYQYWSMASTMISIGSNTNELVTNINSPVYLTVEDI